MSIRFEAARRELDGFMRKHAPPHFATVDAPDSWERLTAWHENWKAQAHAVGTCFVLPVSSEHSEDTVYLTPEGNHAFRAWHDESHLRFGLKFTTADEKSLAAKHQIEAEQLGLSKDARYLLWCDTYKQTEYEAATGEFPENQLEFCRFWFERYAERVMLTADEAYDLGLYVFEVPPVCTARWTRSDWMKVIKFTVEVRDV